MGAQPNGWPDEENWRRGPTSVQYRNAQAGPVQPPPQPAITVEPFYTVPEAARIANINERYLYRRIERGQFKAYKIGDSIRIRLSDMLVEIRPTRNANDERLTREWLPVAEAETSATATNHPQPPPGDSQESKPPATPQGHCCERCGGQHALDGWPDTIHPEQV